jgi:6-phosphogluconolactonase
MKKIKLLLSAFTLSLLVIDGCKKEEPMTAGENISAARPLAAGAVYTMDNAISGNHILAYNRSNDGALTSAGMYSTEGTGTGTGLGSQGSLILSGNYLFATNAGDNTISVLEINNSSLTLLDTVSSYGIMPVSLTVYGNLVYVLNAGGTGNISGFTIDSTGQLSHIESSDQSLSSTMAGGAQIQFNESGTYLIVTEKNTNMITVYPVDSNGVAGTGISHPSTGTTPFGFALRNDILIVSDAFGGAMDQSALTSYMFSASGDLTLITGPVGTNQTAACWVVITNNGRYTYTTNTGSASITGYSISNTGALTLLNSNGVTGMTGTTPIDMALNNNSKYLYNLNSGSHSITMFSVNTNGSLTAMGAVTGLPEGSVGLAAK